MPDTSRTIRQQRSDLPPLTIDPSKPVGPSTFPSANFLIIYGVGLEEDVALLLGDERPTYTWDATERVWVLVGVVRVRR